MKEGNVLFNDALNTFYLRLYGVRHMVKDHSDSERGNPLPPHRLLFPISSKGSIIPHRLCYTSRGALVGTRNSYIYIYISVFVCVCVCVCVQRERHAHKHTHTHTRKYVRMVVLHPNVRLSIFFFQLNTSLCSIIIIIIICTNEYENLSHTFTSYM